MRSLPFTLLFFVCLGVLLGVRFALAPLAATIAAADDPHDAPDVVMAPPPKPEGLEAVPAGEGGGSSGAALLTQASCDAMPADVRDVCLQSLARQMAPRDPQGALGVCPGIADEELRYECRADVAEASAPVDRAGAEAICRDIPSIKWRGQCNFGIGLAMAETDHDYALGRCKDAEIFLRFCRHDVVGEVSLVDVDAAVAFCAKEEGDPLTRSTCWHGIGKYLARRDPHEAAAACGRATESWRGNCFHGLGWGAAERDADAALAFCPSAGTYADNCRQGVAHQLKRFDSTRAVAICESIATDSIRARCLDFMKR